MKKTLLTVLGTVFGYQAHASAAQAVPVRDLSEHGISLTTILDLFQAQHGVTLSLDENVLVSYEEEGSQIRFDTLDHHSVTVPIESAHGAENKVDGSGGA